LKSAIDRKPPIRYTPHQNERGKKYMNEACTNGWEGLIAKNAASPYIHSRSKKWLRFKCLKGQELVIGGFTEP